MARLGLISKKIRKDRRHTRIVRSMETAKTENVRQKPHSLLQYTFTRIRRRMCAGAIFPAGRGIRSIPLRRNCRISTTRLQLAVLGLTGNKKMMVRSTVKRAQHRAGQHHDTQHDLQKNEFHFLLRSSTIPFSIHANGQKPSTSRNSFHFSKISHFRKREERKK